MLKSNYILPLIAMLMIFFLGCGIHSKHKTRSFMSEEELQAIDEIYNPPQEDEEEEEEIEIEPFLDDYHGPAFRVNGLDVDSGEVMELYEYAASLHEQDLTFVKRKVVSELISTYAVMSQWPDTIGTAIEKLDELREQVESGTDFGYLIVENSQEPGAEELAGDLKDIDRNMMALPFEMHTFTAPVGEIRGPFPTIFGWHLIEVMERDDESANPRPHVRHLLLFHGLDPENGQEIREKVQQWTMMADVEIIAHEIKEIFPEFDKPAE